MKNYRVALLLLVAITALSTSTPAVADSFGPVILGYTNNPCQGTTCVPTNTNIAYVSAVQNSDLKSVTFTITALSGYAIQLQANNFFDFNTDITPLSSLTISPLTIFTGGSWAADGSYTAGQTITGVSANLNYTVSAQSGLGKFDLGLNDTTNAPKDANGTPITGADQVQFTISLGTPYLYAHDFYQTDNTVSKGYNFDLHFCDGTGPSCTQPTGFVADIPSTTVPEPGSMLLLGSGLATLAGLTSRFANRNRP